MKEIFEEFAAILNEEENILNQVAEKQKILRESVHSKNWNALIEVISKINILSDSFQHFDFRRDEIQKNLKKEDLKPFFEKLSLLHSKLLKCKAENQALGTYVNMTRAFVQQIIDKALPKSRNANYSRNGQIVKAQPQSVVVNQLF